MKKDKGVAIQNPKEEEEDDDEEEDAFDRRFQNAQSPALPFSTRNASSKYDFVKVYSSDHKSSSIFFSFLLCCQNITLACSIIRSIQVKVWLGDNADHYYVLSRFLLSRMLTVTKVKQKPPAFTFGVFLIILLN